jgi:hypothetical protein
MNNRFPLLCLSLVAAGWPVAGLAQSRADLATLLTRAERTDYQETSRYADVVDFVERVAAASSKIHLTRFGYTFEGRGMPLLVVGTVEDADAASVRATGKTRVFIQANIHAGEVCGKEAMQMLLREIALGQHAEWLDSLVLLIAPIYNADGNERVLLTNRGRQHGPLAGMGQRPNAQGFDLNRDHMKLDSPEARALVRLMTDYDPHVGIDLHTTNGTRHGYHITYSPPLHPNTNPAIVDLLREEWLPAAQAYMKEDRGWESFYYGNASQREGADVPGWYTFDYRPRFNNNYLGLRNRFAILSEAYSYATFEERVLATKSFVEGAVRFAHLNASRIRQAVSEADRSPVAGTTLGVRAEPHDGGEITILMGEVDEVRNPYSGATLLERRDVIRDVSMIDYGTFETVESASVPAYYVVPADQRGVLEKLADHGVMMEPLASPREATVEVFRIDSTSVAAREFQGHRERTVFGHYEDVTQRLPAGAVVVRTDQPLGRLVFTLLEPRSDDGLLNWNVLDDFVERGGVYPIVRAMSAR